MNFGLSDECVRKINDVFKRFPDIDSAVLYGSRAKGTQNPGSDIDLTLEGPRLNSALRAQIASELDDLLLPYSIDLSIRHELTYAPLKEHIERVGKVFYKKGK